jgi:hypothetical protein
MSRILPRYTDQAIQHDPLEILLAEREAEETRARAAIARGSTPQADPQDLRGIPCIAQGTTGTSPGTDPLAAYLTKEHHAERHAA